MKPPAMRDVPARRLLASYPWNVVLDTRFTDMDINRHLNNVAVARLYEEGRVRFNRGLWGAFGETDRPHYLIGHVAIDYLGEGQYPAPVTVAYAVGSIGGKSYRTAMALFQDERCIGLSDTVMVFRGPDGAAPIPDRLRAILGEWVMRG